MCYKKHTFGDNNRLYVAEYRYIMHQNFLDYYDILVYMYNTHAD